MRRKVQRQMSQQIKGVGLTQTSDKSPHYQKGHLGNIYVLQKGLVRSSAIYRTFQHYRIKILNFI